MQPVASTDISPVKAQIKKTKSPKRSKLRAELVNSLLFLAEQTANLLPKKRRQQVAKKRKDSTLDQEIQDFYAEIKAKDFFKPSRRIDSERGIAQIWQKFKNQRTPTFSSEEIDMSFKEDEIAIQSRAVFKNKK